MTATAATREALQRSLLLNPHQPELWQRLNGDAAPQPEALPPRPSAPVVVLPSPPPPVAQLPADRSLQRVFEPLDGPVAARVAAAQMETLAGQVVAGRHRAVIDCLDIPTLPALIAVLSPSDCYALGDAAFAAQRHDLSGPLMQATAAAGEAAGDLLPWALLFAARSALALGQRPSAADQLAHLIASAPQAEAAFHAQLTLAWFDLENGDRDSTAARLAWLQASSFCASHAAEVELVARVLSTLAWLQDNPRDQLPHAVDKAAECGFVAAIDAIGLSPCGTLLRIDGWIVDASRQLRELCLVRGARVHRLDLGSASYFARPDLQAVMQRCGAPSDHDSGLRLSRLFIADERQPLQAGEAAELFVVLHNGEQFCLRQLLQSLPLSTDQLKQVLNDAISDQCVLRSPPALARVRDAWYDEVQQRLSQPAEHNRHGLLDAAAELSVVVPLYGRIDFMEYQLNWFNAWRRRRPDAPQLQLIYVLDDPSLEADFRALTKRCQTLYRIPFETVINPRNLGFAGANNRGAAYATAPWLLLFNSDVLPAHDLSLETLLRAMQQHHPAIAALGARLLFDNGAIQHMGMEFVKEDDLDGDLGRVWLNDHPLKGVNVNFSQADRHQLREVESVTAACLLVATEHYRAVGGFDSHFIVGDFEDTDLCWKLRQNGGGLYVDLDATFYHLERQSVNLADASGLLRQKVVAANAFTHHQRWCSAIDRLKHCRLGATQP
ncbi:MAG: glycosyltransferase [Prochlorococcaceae cyanobacterium]